jgi:hypothetical protein
MTADPAPQIKITVQMIGIAFSKVNQLGRRSRLNHRVPLELTKLLLKNASSSVIAPMTSHDWIMY